MPAALAGRRGIMSLIEWSGEVSEGHEVLGEIQRELDAPAGELADISYLAIQQAHTSLEVDWVRDTYAALRPFLSDGVYSNFMEDDDDDSAGAAYGDTLERLARIKGRYDPDNVFRLNQNITPVFDEVAS